MQFYKYMKKFDPYDRASQKTIQRIKNTLFFLAAVYIDLRIAAVFSRTGEISRASIWAAVILVVFSAVCVAAQAYSKKDPIFTPLYHPLMMVSGIYTGFVIYMLCSLVCTDILYVIAKALTGGRVDLDWFTDAAIVAAFVIVIKGYRRSKDLVLTNYTIHPEHRNVSRPYRIVQLSDLHIGAIIRSNYMRKVIDMVNSCEPDLIVITGDILNHGSTRESRKRGEISLMLSRMKAPDGVMAICGNHDPDRDDPEFKRFLRICGIRQVDNSVVVTDTVNVVGRTGVVTPEYDRTPLRELMKQTDPEKPVIVLDHDPKGIDEAEEVGADLVLCGHTHAGQLFPMTYIARFYYGKRFLYGYGESGGTQSIVSSGTGFFQTPVRTGTVSEVICIDLI